ncbi:MAG: TniB family NTP-binding protein [Rhodospirillales bacterium]
MSIGVQPRITLVHHARFDDIRGRVESVIDSGPTGPSAILPIIGPTQVGKSQLIASIASQTRSPNTLEDLSAAPFLYLRCPVQPTPMSLAEGILGALALTRVRKMSVDGIFAYLTQRLRAAKSKVVVIDDSHHLCYPGGRATPQILSDWLKNLQSDLGILIVLVGLPELTRIFKGNGQLEARSRPPIVFRPYAWGIEEDEVSFGAALVAYRDALIARGFEFRVDYETLLGGAYAISAGRVGVLEKFFSEILRLRATTLTAEALNKAHKESSYHCQLEHQPFDKEGFEDEELMVRYYEVMNAAKLPMDAVTIAEIAARELVVADARV